MSLVDADMLYKVDAKLREIFNQNNTIPFGGIGIVLVGDLLQIPPVCYGSELNYIFSRPKDEKNAIVHDLVDYECK